jgi:hypothetical protein
MISPRLAGLLCLPRPPLPLNGIRGLQPAFAGLSLGPRALPVQLHHAELIDQQCSAFRALPNLNESTGGLVTSEAGRITRVMGRQM